MDTDETKNTTISEVRESLKVVMENCVWSWMKPSVKS